MTLEEAIRHAEEKAKCGGRRCGRMYHAQLAMWLKELQERRAAELEKRTEERTETHACDTISRQAAVEAIGKKSDEIYKTKQKGATYPHDDFFQGMAYAENIIMNLPSAQPEIIRCGQCKYAEVADKEDAQDGYTCQFHRGSIWFSGSYCSWAERRADENNIE